jgi:hypothetical protein
LSKINAPAEAGILGTTDGGSARRDSTIREMIADAAGGVGEPAEARPTASKQGDELAVR